MTPESFAYITQRMQDLQLTIEEAQRVQNIIMPTCLKMAKAFQEAIEGLQRAANPENRFTTPMASRQTLDEIKRIMQ